MKIVRILLICTFFLGFVTTARALNPETHISQYLHTVWRGQEGYLNGNPTAFAQTPDGYLWIGTEGGLYRFDGVSFVQWKQGPRNFSAARVVSLYVARDGSLWVGYPGAILRFNNGTFTTKWDIDGGARGIAEDQEGTIWYTRANMTRLSGPVCRLSANKSICYGEPDGIQTPTGSSLAKDKQGRLWIGGDGSLTEWSGKLIHEFLLADAKKLDVSHTVAAVAVDGDGAFWVGVADVGPKAGLQRFVNGKWSSFSAAELNGADLDVDSLLIDRDGSVWVGTGNKGLYRIHGGTVDHFGRSEGLSSDDVEAVFQDREGSLWVATGEGVDHLCDLPVVSYSSSQGLRGHSVDAVLGRRDGSLAVLSLGFIDSIRGSTVTHFFSDSGTKGEIIGTMMEDHRGDLWVGTDDGGLAVLSNGRLRVVIPGGGTGVFQSLAEDTNHDVWGNYFGSNPRLVRIKNYKVQQQFTSPEFPGALSVIADPHGGIWLGLSDGKLMRCKDGEWHDVPLDSLHKKYGSNQRINSMWFDANGTLWGSSTGGIIGYRNGKLQLLNERNGLPCSFSHSVVTDRNNDLWIQGQCGLMRIEHSELERWWANPESKLNVSTYAATEGFRMGDPLGRPVATRSNDGRLWFQDGAQAMMIDPDHVAGNTAVPPVHVQQVMADRTVYPVQNGLHLPVRTRQLEFDYAGLSLVMPSKVQFRYILEGHDGQWQEPGTRRAAFYNDLAPGTYTFRVMASNNSGLWNTQGDSLQLTIPPAYYQTSWFRALCVLALLALLWLLYQLRLQQLRQEFVTALETRIDERTRIARELHDTLLQSFQGAVFQFQAARRLLLRSADNAMGVVDEAIQAAEEGITEGRAAIHDLRPEPPAQRNLPELLNAAGRELAAHREQNAHPPSFRVIVEGKERSLALMVQDEVYSIAREVIRNAFHHAAASHIEVEIHYAEDLLRVRIRDDGKGIDPRILKAGGQPGHWGIPGMRERAQRIGSQLEFCSEVGAGTEVQLTVPGAMAYTKQRDGHRFRLFRRAG